MRALFKIKYIDGKKETNYIMKPKQLVDKKNVTFLFNEKDSKVLIKIGFTEDMKFK